MRLSVLEECPHCAKALAVALDHWVDMFQTGGVSDDFGEEIAELLADKAQALRNYHSEYAQSLRLKAQLNKKDKTLQTHKNVERRS